MSDSRFHSMKDLPSTHLLGTGTAMCAGCGGLAAVNQIYDVLGKNTVFVNAAGCMTLLSIYPFTPFRGSWLYTSMASAPAGAQGVRDALDLLLAKKRIPPEEDLSVVTLMGDGAANGMALSATSGAIDRGLDFLCVCYDNEGYANTGQQSSEATPLGARTSTESSGSGHGHEKKDLFGIWVANRPAYAATVIAAEPVDLARKLERAQAMTGPRMILALAPCPTGWGFDPKDAIEIGRLAVRTGIWPLKEYVDGRLVHTKSRRRGLGVEAYLERQDRFRHLFAPRRDDAAIAAIQARVDEYWDAVHPAGTDGDSFHGPSTQLSPHVSPSDGETE
jgi:pyruvate ferredoxin oxidoreductase beta subunit